MDDATFMRVLSRLETLWAEPPDDREPEDLDAREEALERAAEERYEQRLEDRDELRWEDWA